MVCQVYRAKFSSVQTVWQNTEPQIWGSPHYEKQFVFGLVDILPVSLSIMTPTKGHH